jgi:hypothetical protein
MSTKNQRNRSRFPALPSSPTAQGTLFRFFIPSSVFFIVRASSSVSSSSLRASSSSSFFCRSLASFNLEAAQHQHRPDRAHGGTRTWHPVWPHPLQRHRAQVLSGSCKRTTSREHEHLQAMAPGRARARESAGGCGSARETRPLEHALNILAAEIAKAKL